MNHIEPPGPAGLQVSRNSVEHLVWLANNHMVSKTEQGLRLTAGIRPTDHRAFPEPAGAREDVDDIGLLDMHPADHDQVGPHDVRVKELIKSSIDQPDSPILRTQSGDSNQPKRGHGGFFGKKSHHPLKTPKRGRKLRPNHQHLYGRSERWEVARLARVIGRRPRETTLRKGQN